MCPGGSRACNIDLYGALREHITVTIMVRLGAHYSDYGERGSIFQ